MATDFRLKDQLPKLTQRIVQTYEIRGSNQSRLGIARYRTDDKVIAAADDLKEIISRAIGRARG